MDRTYLKKRGQSWYAQLVVPANMRQAIGKRLLVKALGTRDLREANRLKHAVLAEMHRDIARASLVTTPPRPLSALEVARSQREAIVTGLVDEEVAVAGYDEYLDQESERLRRERGFDPVTGDPPLTTDERLTLNLADRVIDGEEVELLSVAITKYLAEVAKRVRIGTLEEKRNGLNEFAAWIGKDVDVGTITRKLAGKYITDWLSAKDRAPATLKKAVSILTSFFTWLQERGVIEANPFALMSKTIKASKRGEAPPRRPFSDAELLQLVKSLEANDPLLPMVLLGAYTGCRREEIATLKVTDIERSTLVIREGKSRAALRSVPIHPCIKSLVDQLAATTTDAYLIPGLITGGRDNHRGHHAGKRFGRALRAAGLTDPALVFHSLRNSFIQRCREAEVPKSTYALIVGHSLAGELGYGDAGGGYSQGLSIDALRAALSKVTYGPLDALARQLGKAVNVTRRSARKRRRKP